MTIKPDKIRKILCIKPRGIGDIVLSTVILENLHNYFRYADIDYLTEDFAAHAVANHPLVNKVLTMSHKEFPLKVALRIRKEKYDMVLDLWSNPRSAQITFLSGIKYRVGFGYRGRKYAYNLKASAERGKHHSAEHNLELLKIMNIPVISKKTGFYVGSEEDYKAAIFIKENLPPDKTIMGIIPSGGWPSKRCDASKWVEICKGIYKKYNAVFLIIWGPGDESDSDYIKNHLPGISCLIPHTSVNEAAGFINRCNIVLANDSGPMHISAAVGKPTLGIFGPTDPSKHGPYSSNSGYVLKEDLFCIICNKRECPYNHECFKDLSVEAVLHELDRLIDKNKLHINSHEKN